MHLGCSWFRDLIQIGLEDRVFMDLPGLLCAERPARLQPVQRHPGSIPWSQYRETGGAVEGLYLHDAPDSTPDRLLWVAYVKTKRPRVGRTRGAARCAG